ncbi:5-oxoprolinase (ATP-hydrolysing) [Fusarium proliferatum]|uniref:5-oxoprolinase (ATP-hydrolysing) n=1 Tax=Gibberella intermedia TaxID=948311 RepID=A0A365NLA1_GIBIN|nr:5-oxoprolinase (ATP-hydrolysing) [Fusarium proliferatum]
MTATSQRGIRIAIDRGGTFTDCSRPKIFDLAIRKPDVLYEKVIEIDERVTLEDYAEDPERTQTEAEARVGTKEAEGKALVRGLSGETVRILKKAEQEDIRSKLKSVYDQGIRSIAVCLMHGYTYPDHEALIGRIAKDIGFQHISLSHELMPMIKLVSRATSVCADAYLTPAIRKYIDGFQAGFEGGLGTRSGGTSTDVSRYGEGRYEHVFETTTAGVTIQSPQLDINTVAAGGGSRLFFRNGLFVVGPESAGAHPGPACYRKGGPATVTDANLVLGRLLPEFFPKIFGENEDQGLDIEASRKVLQELADQVNRENNKNLTVDEVAYGFLTVANETMTRPIRSITEAKGHDSSKHRLATFGGAGGQHAVAIAESLGIQQILVHRYSSVLSAYGMALADVVDERQEPDSLVWRDDDKTVDELKKKMEKLKDQSRNSLQDQGFQEDEIAFEEYLNMRYRGTESALMIVRPTPEEAKEHFDGREWAFGQAFVKQHRYEFGFTLDERDIIVDDVRVRGIGKSFRHQDDTVDKQLKELKQQKVSDKKKIDSQQVYFEGGRKETPIFKLEDLDTGDSIPGPAMLADGTQTIVVTPKATAIILKTHVVINLEKEGAKSESAKSSEDREVDPIMLSIFGHRFMAIAEQMGRALQKTSVSTNVKERLDFSCAIFDATGGLVANAPHLPVHLGSMSTCVRRQAEIWKGRLEKGDVIISNHPSYGGTHLPDVTLLMPAFDEKAENILFYAASRAHHADIGGISAGSMPPHSRELYQEGASIRSEKLVSGGKFDEKRVVELFYEEPAKYPGCSGTRCLADNINDLRAQVSANQKGISLIETLIAEYGEETVQFYMVHIQNNAEQCVRRLLKDVYKRFKGRDLSAVDFMDDGSPIRLKIRIDPEKGEAEFDFSGTGPEVYGNINAPQAITFSAIIYCLRCLISEDIPLNQGCLKPIHVKIPPKSILSPSPGAAVVGGNVLTSQRITDVIFKAFQACAASQGCCNNLTFGFGGNQDGAEAVKGFGYYETIAGGSGAGSDWEGTSGVHCHMTNTRITDSEIFERRYPVLLREFSIRSGSGGRGQHRGGDGVIRDIEFRIPLQVSILSERRVYRPYGLNGGGDGECGLNLWVRNVEKANWQTSLKQFHTKEDAGEVEYEERRINMGAKNTAAMKAGDRIIICTPGGGAWGAEGSESVARKKIDHTEGWRKGSGNTRDETALQA